MIYLGKIHQKLPKVNLSRVSFSPGKKKNVEVKVTLLRSRLGDVSGTKSVEQLEINSKMHPKLK